jgi:carbohydrate kinase (thermoresistant glucokinase family)
MPPIFIIAGVSGSGKTTVGQLLAQRLGIPFFDADDFHSEANIAKMRSGQPLTDDDRADWLTALNAQAQVSATVSGAVFACSALKRAYRVRLAQGIEGHIRFILLDGPFEVILGRLQARKGHYMPPALLQSQFETLEHSDDVEVMDVQASPEAVVAKILGNAVILPT